MHAPAPIRRTIHRSAALFAAVALCAVGVAVPAGHAAATPESQTWDTPGEFDFTVPEGITVVEVELAGASGGNAWLDEGYDTPGGLGATVVARLAVTPGETLVVVVGGVGEIANACMSGAGGLNGGADGGFSGYDANGGGGGGATDLRQGGNLAEHRVLVAGGGGGAGDGYGFAEAPQGGDGGSESVPESGSRNGHPGSSVGGGAGGAGVQGGFDGAAGLVGVGGLGGNSVSAAGAGGGGGGGYFGGGGGGGGDVVADVTHAGGGGGGGSSYADPVATSSVVLEAGINSGDGSATIRWGLEDLDTSTTTTTTTTVPTSAPDPGPSADPTGQQGPVASYGANPDGGSHELTVDAGGSIEIASKGWTAGTEVVVTMHSDPVELGRVAADSSGVANGTFVIPSATPPGAHTVVLSGTGANGVAATVQLSLTVRAPSGPGSGGSEPAGLAFVC